MKSILFFFCLPLCCCTVASAQSGADSTVYYIHKFEQNIGKETAKQTQHGDTVTYHVTYHYVDRGSPVELTADIQVGKKGEPLSFRAKGGTSRFSQVSDSVVVHGKTATEKVNDSTFTKAVPAAFFPVAGYSPATAQRLLIQYWQTHRQPASIALLPYGTVHITKDGNDTLMLNNTAVYLNRYVITGLIWGNELVWTNAKGELYCLITNDAEGDKQEVMLAPYEALLPQLIERAAVYGMQLFRKSAKPVYEAHNVIAITNGTLVDVVTGVAVPNTTVIIENGIIKEVRRGNSSTSLPANAFVIDARGKTILPGLWDMHAHFEQAEWGPAYLAAGVTTVRDCGNEFGYINTIQRTIDSGGGIGPHILKAGIIDGKGPEALGIIQADTKEEAAAAVDRYKANGFAQIKIYSSVKPAIVKAICDEAHRLGLTVTGHIPDGMTLMQGVDSGMNMVNHVQYVASVLKRGKEKFTLDFDDSASRAVFSFIKQHHVVIDPTLGVFELAFRPLSDSIQKIEPNFATLPQPLQVIFTNTGLPPAQYDAYGKAVMTIFKQTVTQLYKDSITMVAGTDMGFPGYSLDRELELYVECGLPPMEAIRTATLTPARVMGLGAVTGSVEAGKEADIILVDGNPLTRIRDIRNVTTVIKNGKVYSPSALHKVAGFSFPQ